MKKYVVYNSTNARFEGLIVSCEDELTIQCLSEAVDKDLESSKITKTIKGYAVQNEHFTLILKEVI